MTIIEIIIRTTSLNFYNKLLLIIINNNGLNFYMKMLKKSSLNHLVDMQFSWTVSFIRIKTVQSE